MNEVAKIPSGKQSLIASMATQYGMEPKAFADTVKATCMPNSTSNEEFAAFLMVAKEYGLNPITREIYAFPKKGGGVQPIVGVDGWFNLINSHPQCDGINFDDEFDDKKNLVSVKCSIYRKDRTRPTIVTEYMDECKRPTEPWQKWPKRMLRHKAAIQCARYAFGFAGIIDPDEAERSPEVITHATVIAPPPVPLAETKAPQQDNIIDAEIVPSGEVVDVQSLLVELDEAMAIGQSEDQITEIWDSFDVEAALTNDEEALQRAFDLRKRQIARVLRAMLNSNPVNAG